MNKKFLKLGLGALLLGSLTMTSCEDTTAADVNDTLTDLTIGCTDVNANNFSATAVDDDGSCEYSNEYMLTRDRWTFDNASTTAGAAVDTMYNLFMTGMYFDYSDDGTFSGLVPGDSGMYNISGTWEFLLNDSYLMLYEDNDTIGFQLTTLTMDDLGITFEEEENSMSFDVTLNLVH